MYTISVWASKHVWLARIAIVSSYFVITLLALFIGDELHFFNIVIPVALFYAGVVLFLSAFFMYPGKRLKHRLPYFYRYQKTCDVILVSMTLFFITCIGNQPQTFLPLAAQPAAASTVSYIKAVRPPGTESANIDKEPEKKISNKALRKVLIQKIHILRKAYKKTSKGGKIALIALSVLVALGLTLLVASLSCSLSCSGLDGAAVLVAILGLSLITFLLIKVIRRITKGPKAKDTALPAT